MNRTRSGLAALTAVVALSFSTAANAEMMRAFWAGDILDAVAGNVYELATGDKLFAEMLFDTDWLTSFAGESQAMILPVEFYLDEPNQTAQSRWTPDFVGQVRFLDNMAWQAFENGQLLASGTWSLDSINFAPRVIPVPAAFPLLLGALGLLGALRRRA